MNFGFLFHASPLPHLNPHLRDSELGTAIGLGLVMLGIAAVLRLWMMVSEHQRPEASTRPPVVCTHCSRSFPMVTEYLDHLNVPGFCAAPVIVKRN